MTFSLYIKFHVLHFFCKLEWLEVHTIRRVETIRKYILISNKCNYYIKELCNATSKLPLYLKASAQFKMGTMRHYFGKFPITCEHYHISRYFSGTFENGQTSKKLASKTCKMFLEKTKISKNRAIELSAKGSLKNIFLWKWTCPELRRGFVKNVTKHPEIFWRFRDFSLWHVTSERLFLLIL